MERVGRCVLGFLWCGWWAELSAQLPARVVQADAQALTVVCAPAWAPSSMLIHPAEPFGMSMGTAYGDTRCQPLLFSVS